MYTDWETQYSTKAKMAPWKMQVIGNLCGLCFRLIHLISNIEVCWNSTFVNLYSTNSMQEQFYQVLPWLIDCVVLALTVGDALGEYIYIYIYLLILPGQLGKVPLIVFSVQLPWGLLAAQPEALGYDMLAVLCIQASVSGNPPNTATDGALLISANLSHMSPTVSVIHNICEKSE